MTDSRLKINSFRTCGHDGFAGVPRGRYESSLIHEAKRMAPEQSPVVIGLIGKHHFDHRDRLCRCLSHGTTTFGLKRGHGEAQLKIGAVTLPPLGGMCISFIPVYGHASWQVFGLAGSLLAPASQFMAEPVLVEAFVPAYRCGAVADFHQIPYSV